MKTFVTGSSLVDGVNPGDIDHVCLFENESDMHAFVHAQGRSSPKIGSNYPVLFVCARNGKDNYICTCNSELFYRFKAFSGVLSLLQEKDKSKRIDLAKACLYWESPQFDGL
jgi:hypothetical protein